MYEIAEMTLEHLDEVYIIEEDSFSIPWSKKELEKEITDNNLAIYIVIIEKDKNEVLGYAGLWHIVNEGHITNIAVKKEYRSKGLGTLLVDGLIRICMEKEMMGMSLEVRQGNTIAQKLYIKHGFKPEGFRKNYYPDTNEDAIIMWKYFNE